MERELIKGQTKSQFDLVSQILDDESTDILDEVEYIDKPKRTKAKSISDVVDEFLLFRQGTLGEKFIQEYQMICEEFIEIVGNISVDSFNKEHIRKYISTQILLPPNRRKNPKYRNLTISQILKIRILPPNQEIM